MGLAVKAYMRGKKDYGENFFSKRSRR